MKAHFALAIALTVSVTAFFSGQQAGWIELSAPEAAPVAVVSSDPAPKRLFRERDGQPYIVIDCYANRLYLRTNSKILLIADCSTGSGGELIDSLTGRSWTFDTPRGAFIATSKLTNPWWRKPDWAYIEEGEAVPEHDADRLDPEMLGEYAIGFGDGYFIHGTLYERLLGVSVTHGCVRLGSKDLRTLFESTQIGTHIYVY